MTSEQARQILLMARAVGPTKTPSASEAQALVAVWSAALADTDYDDAMAAVGALARRTSFIDAADIVREVAAIRGARVPDPNGLPEPNVDPDDVLAWRAERQAIEAAYAAGTFDRAAYERGGVTLTTAPARYQLGAATVRVAIESVEARAAAAVRPPA